MKPTDILKQEHRSIERMMDVLESATERLAKGEQIPPPLFLDIVRFLQIFADQCHHNKEEKLLFPAMGRHGFPMEGGPIPVMLYEHEEGRSHVRALEGAVRAYAAGESTATAVIGHHARGFISLLRAHIEKEDTILFMMADAHIPADAQRDLLDAFMVEETEGAACLQKMALLAMLEKMESDPVQYAG